MAGSIFAQLASFFFLWAAIFSDILLIRFVLIIGNMMLLINGSLGLPRWPEVYNLPSVAIDTIVWSGIAIVLHVYAFSCLLLDERSVRRFDDDNDERLYQFFKMRSGITRRDFLPILNRAKWVKIATAGAVIPTASDFYLLVEGVVNAEVVGLRRREDGKAHTETHIVRLHSGNCFEMRFANVFRIPIGFLNTSFKATSACDNVLLCSWSIDALQAFSRGPPALIQAWRNFIAFCLADIAHRPMTPEPDHFRDPDFDIPVRTKVPFTTRARGFVAWILNSMNPRPPKGLRHRPIPVISLKCDTALATSARLPSSAAIAKA